MFSLMEFQPMLFVKVNRLFIIISQKKTNSKLTFNFININYQIVEEWNILLDVQFY